MYQEKCTACHQENEKVLGSPPARILDKRNPAWILNTEEVLEKDPIAIKLLEAYKTPLLN